MSMRSGITIICDECGKDCSDEKEFRGYKRSTSGDLELALKKAGWWITRKSHLCPKCVADEVPAWEYREQAFMPYQMWCPFDYSDLVQVANVRGEVREGYVKDFWWGWEKGRADEVIVKARIIDKLTQAKAL